MEKKLETVLQITRKTAIPFMIATLFLNIIGYFADSELLEISSFYLPGGTRYEIVFQIFTLSLLIGIINTLFDKETFMKKNLLLYKNSLRIIIVILATIYFVWQFHWFAMNDVQAWISFILTFSLCIVISISISFYATHKRNKEYQDLLAKYKERGKHENNTNRTSS